MSKIELPEVADGGHRDHPLLVQEHGLWDLDGGLAQRRHPVQAKQAKPRSPSSSSAWTRLADSPPTYCSRVALGLAALCRPVPRDAATVAFSSAAFARAAAAAPGTVNAPRFKTCPSFCRLSCLRHRSLARAVAEERSIPRQ